MNARYIIYGLLLFSFSCNAPEQKIVLTSVSKANSLPLGTYDFTFHSGSFTSNLDTLVQLKYEGIVLSIYDHGSLNNIDSVLKFKNEHSEFKLYAAFMWYDLDKPQDTSLWKQTLKKLRNTEAAFWIIPAGTKSIVKNMDESIASICDFAEKLGVQVVLYPHDGAWFESAEETLPLIKKLNRSNLSTSFHVCHELRAGNGKRMTDAFRAVKPYVSLVSISGSDSTVCKHCPDWSTNIKPLDEGNYDIYPFINELVDSRLICPVILHTWGIKNPANEHLKRSLNRWNDLKALSK